MVFTLVLGLGFSLEAGPPNILLITADNLGYGDLRCYRPESEISTPSLNQLAEEGVRLTGFYTASPTCTVSRACLLSGRIPERHGLTRQLTGIEGNRGESGCRTGSVRDSDSKPSQAGTASVRDGLFWEMEHRICGRIATHGAGVR
ncbi:MAG: sulfatase-like hydrolase/transferase [Verrucomicrobiales bacterium]|nr:sulfatase-like hydrolase/transferase [Verrucomicrobiales bacterium]